MGHLPAKAYFQNNLIPGGSAGGGGGGWGWAMMELADAETGTAESGDWGGGGLYSPHFLRGRHLDFKSFWGKIAPDPLQTRALPSFC